MKTFFQFQSDYPSGSGFSLFGFGHVAWLCFIFLACLLSTKWYLQRDCDKRKKARILLGSFLPVMGIYRDVILMITGHFNKDFLPLHLCSMALWIGAAYVWSNQHCLGVVYLLLCVPGAISALLFPDWSMYPFFNYMHIHAFLSHGSIVCLGMWLFFSEEIVPYWSNFWIPMLFGFLGIVIMYPVNLYLKTNYWFIQTPSAGSPLMVISELFGSRWYLVGFILLCTTFLVLWMEILRLLRHLKKIR